MASYIDIPVTTDAEQLRDLAVSYLESQVDGYELLPSHPETWIIEATSFIASIVAGVAAQVPSANFRYLGRTLFGIPSLDGAPAVASTTWIARDLVGHTIDAGTLILIDGETFRVVSTVVIPEGQTSTAAGAVSVIATASGTQGNGLGASADPLDAFAWLDSITVVGTSQGGEDAESDEQYQDRLAQRLQLQAPRPITTRDFEIFTIQHEGVARAAVLDGWNPANSTSGNERMVAVVPIDEEGQAVNSTLADAIEADLEARREVNFVVNVIEPSYNSVDIAYQAVLYDGFDAVATKAAIDSAIADYLSPALWGAPPFGEVNRWINEKTIRINKLIQVIENVEGVRYAVHGSVKINATAADLVMTGAAPLPELDDITGSVS